MRVRASGFCGKGGGRVIGLLGGIAEDIAIILEVVVFGTRFRLRSLHRGVGRD